MLQYTLLKPSIKALPQIDNINSLPAQFLDFFENKIQKIRENFTPELLINPQQQKFTQLCVFRPATALEVRTIIMNSPSKSCELDPMPTWLLKKCILVDEILPIIVRLVNTSLRSGRFPDSFKEAVIRPILKKPNLNTDELKNYRPVSNLQFVSKIIE